MDLPLFHEIAFFQADFSQLVLKLFDYLIVIFELSAYCKWYLLNYFI